MGILSHPIIVSLAVAFLTIPIHIAQATGCHSAAWKTYKTPDADGRIHATVNYSGGYTPPSTTIKGIMEQAVAAWNAKSCTTGVILEEAVSGTGTIEFFYSTDETDSGTGGCASYHTSNDRIYWGENFKTRVSTMSALQARAVFEHELGHFLDLLTILEHPTT